jgi:hypothetical protein
VPLTEHEFLIDQRTTRKMMIGTIDLLTTKQKEKNRARLVAKLSQVPQSTVTSNVVKPRHFKEMCKLKENEDKDYVPPGTKHIDLNRTISTLERYFHKFFII